MRDKVISAQKTDSKEQPNTHKMTQSDAEDKHEEQSITSLRCLLLLLPLLPLLLPR